MSAETSKEIAIRRAKEFAVEFSTKGWESEFRNKIVPEYCHPQADDSGLPNRLPDFVPDFAQTRGIFIVTDIQTGRVFEGKSLWILQGKEFSFCIEIIYTTVAEVVKDQVIIFPKPKSMSQISVLCLDHTDNKWKGVQDYPYMSYHYRIPYFLKAWEKILGKGTKSNVAKVRKKLLEIDRQHSSK